MKRRELTHRLVDKALDVQERTEHHVDLDFSGVGPAIRVYAQAGGWDENRDYDFIADFARDDCQKLAEAIDYLDGLLKNTDPGSGHVD